MTSFDKNDTKMNEKCEYNAANKGGNSNNNNNNDNKM